MMNLAWMAAVAAVIVEKVLTSGTSASWLVEVTLVMFGAVMLISGVPLFV